MTSRRKIVIIQDTREQRPWNFDQRFTIRKMALKTGDYSLHGFTKRICIERKGVDELNGCLTHDWARFEKQLVRLAQMEAAVIVIEGHFNSRILPGNFSGAIGVTMADYGVPFVFCCDRFTAQLFASQWLIATANNIRKKDLHA